MAGKYAHITGSLPKLPAENPQYQDRIEAAKQAILEPPKEDEAVLAEARDRFGTLGIIDAQMKIIHESLLRACAGVRHASRFALTYGELRALKEQLAAWESNTNLLLEAYTQLMTEQMDAEGISALAVDGLGKVSTWLEPYSTVKDKEKFRQWITRDCSYCLVKKEQHIESFDGSLMGLHDEQVTDDEGKLTTVQKPHVFQPNDLQRLLTLPWQTTDSLTRKMLLAGEEPPPGVEVFAKTKIRLGAE